MAAQNMAIYSFNNACSIIFIRFVAVSYSENADGVLRRHLHGLGYYVGRMGSSRNLDELRQGAKAAICGTLDRALHRRALKFRTPSHARARGDTAVTMVIFDHCSPDEK